MGKGAVVLACLGLSVVMSSGCGSPSPVIPSPPQPQVSGAWLGEQTLTDFTGAECLSPAFEELMGFPSQFHATFSQSGNTVAATLDIDHTGGVCDYAGTIDGDALTLTATGCRNTTTLAVPCGNGALRGLLPVSETLRVTVNGNTMTGRAAEIDNVVLSGTSTTVSTLIGNSTITLARQ